MEGQKQLTRISLRERFNEGLGLTLRRLFRHRVASAGGVVVGLSILCAILASQIAPYDPLGQELAFRLKPPGWTDPQGGSHILGTDHLGRDVLSRIIYGSRVSLAVGTASALVGGAIGLLLGLVAGYFGRWVDDLIMRIADVQLSFPFLVLALCVIAILGSSLMNLIIVLSLYGWVIYARVIRASVLSIREIEYVQAARAIGQNHFKILVKHILPNVIAPFFVISSFQVARIIIIEASLGFLGLGVPPPEPTWGNMLADGREYLQDAWWIGTFPGLAIVAVVLGINLLGDGLRDALDPKTYIKH
ncbi:MAG: ABC transporter permease [Deltaproteobacteria bacterium]|nr:ABC transporter permease [Deltaproteobacteria bacterium]